MASFNSFLKGLETNDSLRDYSHANRIFGSNALELSPRYNFLFHVFFELDPAQVTLKQDQKVLGLMVKSVDLPRFDVETKVLNSYNRANIVQSKIKYQPINIVFHDDSADIIRNFWYSYYSFYYRDSDQPENAYSYENKYSPNTVDQKLHGYTTLNDRKSFLKSIRIYSMSRKRAAEYVLVNPVITQFQHGQHQTRSNNDFLEHTMTVEYELVKYNYVPTNNLPGFAESSYYDQRPSPLTRAGASRTIFGPGGLLSSVDSITQDLAEGNFLSARRNLRATQQAFRGTSIKNVALTEVRNLTVDALRGQNSLSRIQVPTVADVGKNPAPSPRTASQAGQTSAANSIPKPAPDATSNGDRITQI